MTERHRERERQGERESERDRDKETKREGGSNISIYINHEMLVSNISRPHNNRFFFIFSSCSTNSNRSIRGVIVTTPI